jgi:phage-related protein
MTSIGPGRAELRIRDSTGAFRVIYVAKFEEAVYALHAFQKKTQRTAKGDIELARDRYRELLDMRTQR